jgi:hypothetical protein
MIDDSGSRQSFRTCNCRPAWRVDDAGSHVVVRDWGTRDPTK